MCNRRCCFHPKRRALFWDGGDITGGGYTLVGVQRSLRAIGVDLDRLDSFDPTVTNHTLADYGLIFFAGAFRNPPWWSSITSGAWRGRLHITSDSNSLGTASIDYLNTLTGLTGITIIGANLDTTFGGNEGPTIASDLTRGVSTILHSGTSKTSGGTTLSLTVSGSQPWLARNIKNHIDWVVAGNRNHMVDGFGPSPDFLITANNARFFQNLLNSHVSCCAK